MTPYRIPAYKARRQAWLAQAAAPAAAPAAPAAAPAPAPTQAAPPVPVAPTAPAAPAAPAAAKRAIPMRTLTIAAASVGLITGGIAAFGGMKAKKGNGAAAAKYVGTMTTVGTVAGIVSLGVLGYAVLS